MQLFANPYHAVDHKGRLAGACSEAEPVRPSGPMEPLRRWIGASLHMTPGSFVPDDPSTMTPSSSDTFWKFSDEVVDVHAPPGAIQHHYLHAVKTGEVLAVKKTGEVPILALARERQAAIKRYFDETQKMPDTAAWVEQFPLDVEVSKAAELLTAKREAELAAEKAKADAKAAEAKREAVELEAKRAQAASEAQARAATELASAKRYAAAFHPDAKFPPDEPDVPDDETSDGEGEV